MGTTESLPLGRRLLRGTLPVVIGLLPWVATGFVAFVIGFVGSAAFRFANGGLVALWGFALKVLS